MKRKKRNAAIILLVAALLLSSRWFSFFTIAALLFLAWGVQKFRHQAPKRGALLVFVGALLFIMENFTLFLGLLLIAAGLFLMKPNHGQAGSAIVQKRNLYTVLKRNVEPWFLQDMRLRHGVGDVDLDLSLAIPEQHESIIVLEGLLGDVDIFVPEETGVYVEAEVLLGRISINGEAEPGVWQKTVWQSPHSHLKEHQVKLFVSYLVGDIAIHAV